MPSGPPDQALASSPSSSTGRYGRLKTIVSKTPSTPEYTSVSTISTEAPASSAFLRARSTALGFMSPARTMHPFSAQCIDTTPDPHPISSTLSPSRTSMDSMSRMLSSDGG